MTPDRRLGQSDIRISPIGLGCWQFSQGKGFAARLWPVLAQQTMTDIVSVSLQAGVNWFDTAELYGWGRSESALSAALIAAGKRNGDVVVATKWWPVFRTASSINATINARLEFLAPFGIDLHQVHNPFSLATTAAEMRAMAELIAEHRIRTVGVSNFPASMMRRAHDVLANRGIPLVSNQVRYNLLDRRIERNGVLAAARELGITIIAYSPLAQGILSGKYHRGPAILGSQPKGRRRKSAFQANRIGRCRPLIEALEQIGQAYGATAAQVALNWVIQYHGDIVVAIPGATNATQAASNAAAADLRLTAQELSRLDRLSGAG